MNTSNTVANTATELPCTPAYLAQQAAKPAGTTFPTGRDLSDSIAANPPRKSTAKPAGANNATKSTGKATRSQSKSNSAASGADKESPLDIDNRTTQAVNDAIKLIDAGNLQTHDATVSMLRKLKKSGGQAQKATRTVVDWYNSKRLTANHKTLGLLMSKMCKAVERKPSGKLAVVASGASFVWDYVDGWNITDWNVLPESEVSHDELRTMNALNDDLIADTMEAASLAAKRTMINAAKRFYAALLPELQTNENMNRVNDRFGLPENTLGDLLAKAK